MSKFLLAGIAAGLLSVSLIAVGSAAPRTKTAQASPPTEARPAPAEADDGDDLPSFEDYAQYGAIPETSRREGRGAEQAQYGGQRRFRPRRMQALCGPEGARIVERMQARIEALTKPTEAQRAGFDKLKVAMAKAHEARRASCPVGNFASLPLRLGEVEKQLAARLDAIRIMRPAMEEYYATLNDEQKAQMNLLGRAGAWPQRGEPRGPERDGRRGRRRDGDDFPRPWRGRS